LEMAEEDTGIGLYRAADLPENQWRD